MTTQADESTGVPSPSVPLATPQAAATPTLTAPEPTAPELTAPQTTVAAQPTSTPEPLITRTGAAVLVDSGFAMLDGQRVGLIAHRASVVDGRHLAVLIDEHPTVELVALFAPEHGLYGTNAAGALVDDDFDPVTGTPIFSLYGTDRSPTGESLANIDVLVYDLQDVGTRFFTYTSTLGLSMQAAADAGIPIVVLDRPNPLGATAMQGPTMDIGLASFIGMYPVPSAYGLTSGELARLIKQQQLLPGLDALSLQVLSMQNWQRSMQWGDTGLPWIAPSPNLPSAAAATVYPGTVLFEATSISEGRGTDEPFQLIGAPWVDGVGLAVQMNGLELPGVEFQAAVFTPRSIPGAAPSPRYLGEELNGVRIVVHDPSQVRGVQVGLHLLDAMLRQGEASGIAPASIIDRPDVFDRLAGSATVRVALSDASPVPELLASFEADHLAFRELLTDVVLYD